MQMRLDMAEASTPSPDTSVGAFREMESAQAQTKARKLRQGRSKNFVHFADAIDAFGRLHKDQRYEEGNIYQAVLNDFRINKEITNDEFDVLLNHLEGKYPGGVLPENNFMWDWLAEKSDRVVPFPTDNPLLQTAQQYIGFHEGYQTGMLKNFFKEQGVETIDPVYKPWCASYIGCVLKEAGYETPKGADILRARKYAKLGKPGTGDPGDLMVYPGHVQMVVRADPDGSKWIIGGNQHDKVSIRKIDYIPKPRMTEAELEAMPAGDREIYNQYIRSEHNPYGYNFMGFRTPTKKAEVK